MTLLAEIGVYLAILFAIGGFVGWSLRDIAEFVPAASRAGLTESGAGSYLFRDALAGTGAATAYMRTTTGGGAPVRARLPLPAAALVLAPASGGYTFPAVRSADSPPGTRRPASTIGLRRHWTWPAG